MRYESLFAFPPVFRRMAAELKPSHVSNADLLGLLIARHWLEVRNEKYKSLPFEMSDTGGLKLRSAIQCPNPDDPRAVWFCHVAGVEGEPSGRLKFRVKPLAPQYTHVWLWIIMPPERGQFAHHWRMPVEALSDWVQEGDDRVLASADLMAQAT